MRINVRIEGTTPLLCNRFTDSAAMAATSSSKTMAVGDKGTPMEQAQGKLYIGANKKPMIPQPNVFRSIIDAGKFFKHGKSKVTTQKSSLIPACMAVDGIELAIIHKEPWTVDTRAVRIPATGGRILCHRPCFHDWALEFSIILEEQEMAPKFVREIVDKAGRAIGLGDFRPDCKGPFGKFVVTKWVIEED